ncbi:hypothetical protein GRU39_000782 [Salmonella enterica]|nr:hypothetical protein [Salmonella enterica subsp. enterica serovar Javiana]EDR5111469.1 hypothetical protein [Salmonella enterica]EDT6422611.1 hypothetical protein [Salmonella enterica subsp. enterica]EDR3393854.1 hypothetical protein [Salmonella enterica subsp. enterica serovar Javiana]EDR3758458.1 hypothetical protein [Salmonella enterica subsp. enterica serovar Javiana]
MAHWVLKQWPQLALDAISQITFQMDNKHSSLKILIVCGVSLILNVIFYSG